MTDRLNVNEDTAVEGFIIGKLLTASDESALYETEYAAAPHRTVLELRQGDTEGTDRRLALWLETARLSHPHLLQLHTAGHSVVNDVPVIYAVMERADESLAEALAARSLTQEEAREILRPALSALDYLHRNGYTMGGLTPSKIVAVENILKLSTDGLERSGEGGNPAEDMREFGALLALAIAGPVPEASGPLGDIVTHCLDANSQTRWRAEEALASLTSTVEQRAAPVAVPVGEEFPSIPPDLSAAQGNTRRSIYVAVAALLFALALIGWLAWHRSSSGDASAIAPPTPVAAPAMRETPATVRVPSEPAPIAARTSARQNSWVVVIASYAARVPAEKRVREIAKKWPRFHVELLEAASEKTHLLVVIGKNLSEKEAEALRSRARSAGLPRDTYIKRIDTGNG